MSARAAAAVVLVASLGVGAYLVFRARGQADLSGLEIPFDDSASMGDVWAAPADGEYDAGALDAVGDAVLPIAYKIENVFSSVWGGRMNMSVGGLAHLKRIEGLSLTPYKDVAGYWTIGYGHLIKAGEWWDSITEAKAEQLLDQDNNDAEDAVNSLVKVPLSQPQFDALASFVFNVGVGAFRRSTMLKRLNAGDYAAAAAEFPKWRKAGGVVVQGLVNRRATEMAMFTGSGYA